MEMALSALPPVCASLRKCRGSGLPSPGASFQALDLGRGESLTAEPQAPEAVGVCRARCVPCLRHVCGGELVLCSGSCGCGPSLPGGQQGGVTPVPWLLPPPAIRPLPSSSASSPLPTAAQASL